MSCECPVLCVDDDFRAAFILFSGLSVSPYVILLSLVAILCTVLYRVATHKRTILEILRA